jgi:hypothetical protein
MKTNRRSFFKTAGLGWTAGAVSARSSLPWHRSAPGSDVVDIRRQRQLFLDGFWIARASGVSRKLHEPAREGVAVVSEHPWESLLSAYHVVLRDGNTWRLYYLCSEARGESGGPWQYCALAESSDGIAWSKPRLGVVDFRGSKQNNLVYGGPLTELAPFLDANPDAKASERYKAVGRLGNLGTGNERGLVPLASPDGLRWRPMRDEPVLTEGPFDSHNLPFWDTRLGTYVVYTRGKAGTGGSFKGGVRWIRRATSPDFIRWTRLEPIDTGEVPAEHLYTNACTVYERAPGTYLMFPSRFVPDRTPDNPVARAATPGVNDIVLMSSRDGIRFDRSFKEAFIRPGQDVLQWRERGTYVGQGIVQTSPGVLSLYSRQHRYQPSVHIRRYALRTDGFVSVNAGYSGGECVTRALVFEGNELEINYSTSAIGSVRVEIQDAGGKAIPGFELGNCPEKFGDEIDGMVSWKGGSRPGSLAGRPVRLRIALKDADLYAFRFR